MEGYNAFLPDEVIFDILTRLPVKTLIRFQCVCKTWKNLFKTPSFITHHLHHSTNRNPSLLLPLPKRRSDPSHFPLCLLNRDLQLTQVHNAPFIGSLSGASIVGSSNGLVCLQLWEYRHLHRRFPDLMLVWNPATREERIIPGTIGFDGDCYFGFGFSPVANDYKIVRIYGCENFYGGMDVVREQDITKCVNGVEVYSLSTGSWKQLEFGDLVPLHFSTDNAITIDGAMFWLGSKKDVDGDGRGDFVVSFDIALEVFTLIAMPILDSDLRFKLTLFEDKLALLSSTINFYSCSVYMWVIEEDTSAHGKRWSISEKHISHSYPYGLLPMTIWRNEIVNTVLAKPERVREIQSDVENNVTNFVLGETECGVEGDQYVHFPLALINLTTNQEKFIVINKWAFFRVFNYVESLVPVGKVVSLLLQISE